MLLAVPYMRLGSKRYLWEYRQLQRRMEGQFIIHAVSHPPLGSLVVRWIGRQAGARVRDRHHVRETEQQIRYALGQTVVSMFNLVLVFAFGAALFGRRAGLLAAALWTVAPTVSSYATFAPDMNYALVFHLVLLLAWKVSAEPSLRRALAQGRPVIQVIPQGIPPESELQPALLAACRNGRALLLSPQPCGSRLNKKVATWCNEYVLRHADEIWVGDISPNGMLATMLKSLGRW